ncbi:MAG: response regulator transcription factor [Alphaproteobacteria bacterium]|nr:response regulator transcription factor [Alphaproteobacteria bacterium]
MKLLVIEDDQATAEHVRRGLSETGHSVSIASDGRQGLEKASAASFDALIIDRMLPELDGLSIVKRLRATGNHTPILFLTTMSGLDDRVEGLEAGADDYLVKPFAMPELLARLNALARRPHVSAVQTTLRAGELEMDLLRREVRRAGKLLDLQPQEFKLLEYLLRSDGRIVTKTMLLEHVWGFHFDPQTTVVETHMSRLRAKLDKGHDHQMIVTQRGVGYRLVA